MRSKNQDSYAELSAQAEAARDELINVVNNFFYDRLVAVPEIKTYLEQFQLDDHEGLIHNLTGQNTSCQVKYSFVIIRRTNQ